MDARKTTTAVMEFCADGVQLTRSLGFFPCRPAATPVYVNETCTTRPSNHRSLAATNGTTVLIESPMKLWIPIITPSLEATVALEEKLNQGAVQKLNWEAFNCYRSGVIPAADTSFTYRVTTSITPRWPASANRYEFVGIWIIMAQIHLNS